MSIHTRRSLPPMTLLAMCIAMAAVGCSERPAPVSDTAGATPAAVQSDHHGIAPADAHQPSALMHHEHAAQPATAPALPATPWPSDAPLREGMRRMQKAVAALEHADHQPLDAAQAAAAAQQIQDAANYMIANCKLPAAPDAALHGVLATLMTGAAAVREHPGDTSPVASMRDAIALYPRMFEDATWQADTATEL